MPPPTDAERRLAALVESSGDAIIALDVNGLITDWNAAAAHIYGFSAGEAVGARLTELIIPSGRRRELQSRSLEDLARHGAVTAEVAHMRSDGTVFPVQVVTSTFRGADGAIAGVSLIARDISDRLAHERELERLARIVESSNDAIISFDRDGVITVWSGAAERMLGWAATEKLGQPLASVTRSPERIVEVFEQLDRGETVAGYASIPARDGRDVEIHRTAFPIREQRGRIMACGVIMQDVSEQRRLELQLRQAQKMEAVGQLAGGVAHDFNNLLMVIKGYAEIARGKLDGGTAAHELAEIDAAAARAAEVTQKLLAFSRRQLLDPVALDLGEVVTGLEPLLRRLIGEDIQLALELARDVPRVLADQVQLEGVLINLAVNARDAMPGGGTLTIATRTDGSYACLEVCDTGVGIAAEQLPHLFEPFYTTKEVGAGTGLGLATVDGVIAQSGGHIRVASSPGAGATFSIFLPAAEIELAALPAEVDHTEPRGGKETVLVCEDEAGVRRLLEYLLVDAGYRVLTAGRPSEALELVAREPIDALVSDVIMPDMPGPELARIVQERDPRVRTLFVSGYTAETVRGRGNLPAGSAFLEKPIDRATLLGTLRELFDRQTL